MLEKPKVSICMITYGHEKYIREAIESVLMQKTSFPFELVLANDCSPDNTDKIVQDILNNHIRSANIKYIKQAKNIGMMTNFIDAIKNCNGKYIAFCEGDDYWVDEYKLQKQVELLEDNSSYSGVATGYQNVVASGETINTNTILPFGINVIETKHLLQKNLIATCTVLLKNSFAKTEKDFNFLRVQMLGDLSVWLLSSLNGPIYFLPDVTAAYRNGVGVSNTFGQLKNATVALQARDQFTTQYKLTLKQKLPYWCAKPFYLNHYSCKLAEHNKKTKAIAILFRSVSYIPFMLFCKTNLQRINSRTYLKTIKAIVKTHEV
jgi:glycosyltransferase involved in cell wall biosynthesis